MVTQSCIVDNCPGKLHARGMCSLHYQRMWKHTPAGKTKTIRSSDDGLYAHVRCGGTLHAETHPRWTARSNVDPHTQGIEILHRCDRCDHIGVLTEPPQ